LGAKVSAAARAHGKLYAWTYWHQQQQQRRQQQRQQQQQ
jgi:hypothetical protein